MIMLFMVFVYLMFEALIIMFKITVWIMLMFPLYYLVKYIDRRKEHEKY
jgi:hypothetical protein